MISLYIYLFYPILKYKKLKRLQEAGKIRIGEIPKFNG